MGGSIFVGIRTPDGAEHLSIRWTNSTSWELADPDMYTDGPLLREFINRAEPPKHGDTYGYDMIADRIYNPEYGIILVDLLQPGVWTENGYTALSHLSVAAFSSAFEDELEILCKLADRGWLTGMVHDVRRPGPTVYDVPLTADEQAWYMERARARTPAAMDEIDERFSYIRAGINRAGFEFHSRDWGPNVVAHAEAWARARGWKSPFGKDEDQ